MRNRRVLTFMKCAVAVATPASLSPQTHAQEQLWTHQFGTSIWDVAWALAPVGDGDVVVAGYTSGSLGAPNAGWEDVFLARFDGAKNRRWIRQLGTGGTDEAHALALDGADGVMVAGHTWDSLSGPSRGSADAFLARFDGAGNQLWIRQFGTTTDEWAVALAPDEAGGVMVAGWTFGALVGTSAGSADAFLARYDGEGNRLWMRQFGTSSEDWASALAPDGEGGVLVAGNTRLDLGGPNAGAEDAFIARYDSAGNQLWMRQFGTSLSDEVKALSPDGAGGVMVAGSTRGRLGGLSAGSADAFLARYDGGGNQLWTRQFGTSAFEEATALAPDGTGGVMVAGYTMGSLGGHNAGWEDAFLAHYNSAGTRLWIRQIGTSESDLAYALAQDGARGIIVAGYTGGSLGGPNAGWEDVFLARFGEATCYPDCDTSTGDGVLDIFDFLCFQNSFVSGEPYACDCDPDPACNIFDFLCFQDAFVNGCP